MTDKPTEPAITTDTCSSCRYFMPTQPGSLQGTGYCRRYPPMPMVTSRPDKNGTVNYQTIFPLMQAHGWCGEFKARMDS